MKTIKSFLAGLSIAVIFNSPALAQNNPAFCQIHDGNVGRYVSQYDIFSKSSATPYRPFISNSQPYQLDKQLRAQPLYYLAFNNSSIIVAFQLSGKIRNSNIGRDKLIQVFRASLYGDYAQIVGYCVNGKWVSDSQDISIYEMPVRTQDAIQEAKLGIIGEQTNDLFR
jgi:hypothetical protein